MANGNSNVTVWKVLASVALVLSVVSGSWALSATLGPKEKISELNRRIETAERVCTTFTEFKGAIEKDILYIREAIARIERKLP